MRWQVSKGGNLVDARRGCRFKFQRSSIFGFNPNDVRLVDEQGFTAAVHVAGVHDYQKRSLLQRQQVGDPLFGRVVHFLLNRGPIDGFVGYGPIVGFIGFV